MLSWFADLAYYIMHLCKVFCSDTASIHSVPLLRWGFGLQSFVTLRVESAFQWTICLLMQQNERKITDRCWFNDDPGLDPDSASQEEWPWQAASCVLGWKLGDALTSLPPPNARACTHTHTHTHTHTRTHAHTHRHPHFTLKTPIAAECFAADVILFCWQGTDVFAHETASVITFVFVKPVTFPSQLG